MESFCTCKAGALLTDWEIIVYVTLMYSYASHRHCLIIEQKHSILKFHASDSTTLTTSVFSLCDAWNTEKLKEETEIEGKRNLVKEQQRDHISTDYNQLTDKVVPWFRPYSTSQPAMQMMSWSTASGRCSSTTSSCTSSSSSTLMASRMRMGGTGLL